MRIILFFLSVLLCLSACSSAPVQQNLLNSMADLDKAYIPAVILTGMGKNIDSKIAIEKLQDKWNEFYSNYYPLEMKYGLNIVDKMWKDDLKAAGADIGSAEALINTGNWPEANAKLLPIRNIFREIRHRHGMQYVLDDMLDFNDGIALIKKKCRQKKMSERELALVKQQYDVASNTWASILADDKALVVFQFESAKVLAIKKKMKKLKQDLPILKDAISAGEKEAIYAAAVKIEKDYLQIYRAFGDFNPILEKQIEKRKRK
ncbi:MAG: hypothetical protein WC890_07480 [Candidatus Margulisiibacteriota bacterium]